MFWKKKKLIQSINQQKDGFEVEQNEGIIFIKWDSINRLVGFKIDKYTIDEVCLHIQFNDQSIILTEEYNGWREFVNNMLIHFPKVDQYWEGKIAVPAFERNETELFNKNQS